MPILCMCSELYTLVVNRLFLSIPRAIAQEKQSVQLLSVYIMMGHQCPESLKYGLISLDCARAIHCRLDSSIKITCHDYD